jgi:hypothetical protein
MVGSCLVVRAEVPEIGDRAGFDRWYATDRLPRAIEVFGAERGWRCWSRTDPAMHSAYYEFADVATAQKLLGSDAIKPLIDEFDRIWGERVIRSFEVLEIVQDFGE